MSKMKPGEMNFDHPAKTAQERGIRQQAGHAKEKADIAREYGYPNIGGMLDGEADRLNNQADDMAHKRKGA